MMVAHHDTKGEEMARVVHRQGRGAALCWSRVRRSAATITIASLRPLLDLFLLSPGPEVVIVTPRA